jgi:hypothetical protein
MGVSTGFEVYAQIARDVCVQDKTLDRSKISTEAYYYPIWEERSKNLHGTLGFGRSSSDSFGATRGWHCTLRNTQGSLVASGENSQSQKSSISV